MLVTPCEFIFSALKKLIVLAAQLLVLLHELIDAVDFLPKRFILFNLDRVRPMFTTENLEAICGCGMLHV